VNGFLVRYVENRLHDSYPTRDLKASSRVVKAAGSVRISDAIVTGGKVVNFERVRSNRKEMAAIGVLLVICILPTRGSEE